MRGHAEHIVATDDSDAVWTIRAALDEEKQRGKSPGVAGPGKAWSTEYNLRTPCCRELTRNGKQEVWVESQWNSYTNPSTRLPTRFQERLLHLLNTWETTATLPEQWATMVCMLPKKEGTRPIGLTASTIDSIPRLWGQIRREKMGAGDTAARACWHCTATVPSGELDIQSQVETLNKFAQNL
eukprot:3991616-Amphidinium_carterae.1